MGSVPGPERKGLGGFRMDGVRPPLQAEKESVCRARSISGRKVGQETVTTL